ncbi:MAG TPA: TolC family protein [Candidatus Dormibacteraeota bacterium]|nr:TolC family protein [Candidatus Dormibacteraeota bacterium]
MTVRGRKCSLYWQIRVLPLLVVAAAFLPGCTAAHYRKSADNDVYAIVQDVEAQVFAHTNTFSIETAYSNRKPADILAGELIEDRRQTNREVLTLDRALDLAVGGSRRYQSAKENLYLTALNLTGQRHAFSPQFFASSSGSVTRTVRGEKYVSLVNKVGVSELLKTGGALSVSLANDILRYYTGEPRRSVLSLISVNVAQPLMRGFGRNNLAVESLTQAERNVIYAVRNYSYFQDQFALEITNDYFDLIGQKDVIRNRYTNYLGRVQSTRRLEARAHDRERLQDVDQARQAELTARNNYVNAVATYRNGLASFKVKLGLALGDQIVLDDRALDDLQSTGPVPVVLEPEEVYRFAVEKHTQVLNAIDRFEDSKRKVRVAADQLRADLKVVGDAALTSDAPTDYTRFDPNKISASAGLELNLPIDRLLERNVYRTTLISFEAELRNFTLTLDTLKDSILHGLRTLDQRRQNYEIQTNALVLANRRVASATMLLEAGRAEVRDLVEAQDAQISAQNAVTTALVDYQQTRLQLLLDTGMLDTGTPQFWLKNPLAASLPAGAPPPPSSDQEDVFPPESYFDN